MKEKLRNLRVESGLTQKELSIKIGSTDKNIWNYEKGLASPPYEILIAYAKYFDVSTDYLLGLEDDFGTRTPAPIKIASLSSDNYSDEERRIIEEYRKLPESSKQLFRRMAGITDKVIKN